MTDRIRINHPTHYTAHPSGVECIDITEHFNFNLGNAIKYIWRADTKGDDMTDIQKALWYIQRELLRREVANANARSAAEKIALQGAFAFDDKAPLSNVTLDLFRDGAGVAHKDASDTEVSG